MLGRRKRLPVADAERVLLRVIRECRESGKFSQGLTLPSEHRFVERQYARALEALIEIADESAGGDAAAETARRVLEVNGRALDQHRDAMAEWESPELREFMDKVFDPDPKADPLDDPGEQLGGKDRLWSLGLGCHPRQLRHPTAVSICQIGISSLCSELVVLIRESN